MGHIVRYHAEYWKRFPVINTTNILSRQIITQVKIHLSLMFLHTSEMAMRPNFDYWR